jgi:hypothetical protein
MNPRDHRSLSKAAADKVELVRAEHEEKISGMLLDWQADAPASDDGPPVLTLEQQSDLRKLLIEMSIRLGETEGREYLAVTPSPKQFEIEIRHLMDAIAGEANERWNALAGEFHLEIAEPEDGKPVGTLRQAVRASLRSSARSLIHDAWSAHKRRLQAQCAGASQDDGVPPPTSSPPSVPPGKQARYERLEALARRVDRLRIDKGMSVEQLAYDAHLDKKTVVSIIHARHRAMPSTLKKLADALSVKASELSG